MQFPENGAVPEKTNRKVKKRSDQKGFDTTILRLRG
jgi:hypothetical protein